LATSTCCTPTCLEHFQVSERGAGPRQRHVRAVSRSGLLLWQQLLPRRASRGAMIPVHEAVPLLEAHPAVRSDSALDTPAPGEDASLFSSKHPRYGLHGTPPRNLRSIVGGVTIDTLLLLRFLDLATDVSGVEPVVPRSLALPARRYLHIGPSSSPWRCVRHSRQRLLLAQAVSRRPSGTPPPSSRTS
jgi:hypothetical protein